MALSAGFMRGLGRFSRILRRTVADARTQWLVIGIVGLVALIVALSVAPSRRSVAAPFAPPPTLAPGNTQPAPALSATIAPTSPGAATSTTADYPPLLPAGPASAVTPGQTTATDPVAGSGCGNACAAPPTSTAPSTPADPRPFLQVQTPYGSNDYTGPCGVGTSVTFQDTIVIGATNQPMVNGAEIDWTFTASGAASLFDSGSWRVGVPVVSVPGSTILMEGVGLPQYKIALPSTAPGSYSITARYTASSPDTQPANPSIGLYTVHVTCTA
jgi:hypothetical protein